MIYGIGTDIVNVSRVDHSLAKIGKQYANNILSSDELLDYNKVSNKAKFLAKRFAAKEALVKALGTGFIYPAILKNITVYHDALGKPELRFDEDLQEYLNQNGIDNVYLSIADESTSAIAFVILSSKP